MNREITSDGQQAISEHITVHLSDQHGNTSRLGSNHMHQIGNDDQK